MEQTLLRKRLFKSATKAFLNELNHQSEINPFVSEEDCEFVFDLLKYAFGKCQGDSIDIINSALEECLEEHK